MIGELIAGKYKVDGDLGQGGMGVVYRARIVRTARPVAIKVLRDDVVGVEQYESRFEAEVLVTTRVRHPNVVEVLDHGYLDDGRPFLVLELLTGRSLGEILLTAETLDWRRALTIMRDVALALGAVHAQEIVHRDIKPENIFLTPQPGGDGVKLMDFGLAKSLGWQEEEMELTQPGFAIGTPAYMAPERVTGDYDCRSDLYGLAVVIYQTLTGNPPFQGQGAEVLKEHLTKVARPLSEANPNLEFPPAVEGLMARALAKQVQDRHQTAAELVTDIERALEGGAAATYRELERITEELPESPEPQPAAKFNPKPLLVAAGALTLLVLILAVAASGDGEKAKMPSLAAAAPKAESSSAEPPTSEEPSEEAVAAPEDSAYIDRIEGALTGLGYVAGTSSTAVTPEARLCQHGKAEAMIVRSCVYASDEKASEARDEVEAMAEGDTSVVVARGRALLWIVDTSSSDPEGRKIQALIDGFSGLQ